MFYCLDTKVMSLAKISWVYFPGSGISLPLKGTWIWRTLKKSIVSVFSEITLCSQMVRYLCAHDERHFSTRPPICNKGSPNKLLSCWFPTTFSAANFGTWLSSCQPMFFFPLFFIKNSLLCSFFFENEALCYHAYMQKKCVIHSLPNILCFRCYYWQ